MTLLSIQDLRVSFGAKGFRTRREEVLKGVSLEIRRGETLGLVGESGSGKTTIGRAVLGLAPVASGTITFDGTRIDNASRRDRRRLARDLQVVFQDPYTSLNPSMPIGATLAEPLIAQGIAGEQARRTIAELLDRVRLPQSSLERLPREFSGGQRQRIAIARALALSPRLIVCDEPVSALDLRTQEAVLDLLTQIQEQTGVAYLFISHDLTVVRHLSHRVAVIHRGQIVEQGDVAEVTERPEHPYTRKLLLAAPVVDPARQRRRRLAFEREFGGAA